MRQGVGEHTARSLPGISPAVRSVEEEKRKKVQTVELLGDKGE